MKLSWGIAATALCSAASATRPSISPETARLIIAQRLGLSRFHPIEHADAEALHHIDTYGGRKQKLFGEDDAHATKAHLLIWVDVADQDEATIIINDGSGHSMDFALDGVPTAAENDRLMQDIVAQAESLPKFPDPQQRTYTSNFEIDAVLPDKPARYNDYLTVWYASKDSGPGGEFTAQALDRAVKRSAEKGFSTTIVMMPVSKPLAKRRVSLWGNYASPAKDARRENPEAFLSLNAVPSTSPKPQVPDLEDFPVIVAQASDKGPVRGILPHCFTSMSACQRTTNNCSSHGECKLLHKAHGKGKDQESLDCYGCACSPTIHKIGKDSRTVTHWGGPACQKRDISIQFWLFVGVGLILTFLAASGIGMLFSMGSEELPSVIGAGVSGPVARK